MLWSGCSPGRKVTVVDRTGSALLPLPAGRGRADGDSGTDRRGHSVSLSRRRPLTPRSPARRSSGHGSSRSTSRSGKRSSWKELMPADPAGVSAVSRFVIRPTPDSDSYYGSLLPVRSCSRTSTCVEGSEIRSADMTLSAGTEARPLRDPRADRRGRDGRGLPRAGPAARARGRDQGAAGVVLAGPRPAASASSRRRGRRAS